MVDVPLMESVVVQVCTLLCEESVGSEYAFDLESCQLDETCFMQENDNSREERLEPAPSMLL